LRSKELWQSKQRLANGAPGGAEFDRSVVSRNGVAALADAHHGHFDQAHLEIAVDFRG
jgi:hypothetical protein